LEQRQIMIGAEMSCLFETAFWVSLFLVGYAYAGYPLFLMVLSTVRSRGVEREAITPSVTIILTVHNEIRTIRKKMENLVALEYPRPLREIIVVSDASTDGTNETVRAFESDGIRLIARTERRGKEMSQQEAIEAAGGEILVITDAAVLMPKDALLKLAGNFADSTVGCVSSTDPVGGESKSSAGESFYLRYEMMLRRLESRVGSLVGLSGSCFACRRKLCHGFQDGVPSDFVVMLNAIRKGLRGVSDEGVAVWYQTVSDPSREFSRKVRTVVRGMTGLWCNMDMLNPFRWGFFSIQLLSHKLIRWLVPLFLAVCLGANAVLAVRSAFYQILLMGQSAFYFMALLGLMSVSVRRVTLVRVSTFFVIVNASILLSWWKFFRGERILKWEPTHR
jgi:glycosyltransferase involved in cell wall biosynthesis